MREDARVAVLAAIKRVAPQTETLRLDPSSRLRQDLELGPAGVSALLDVLTESVQVFPSEDASRRFKTVQDLTDYVAAHG